MRGIIKSIAIAMTLMACAWANAETYPQRTVTLVVPYSPGGGVDATARILAKYLGDDLKQSFIVENRPGPGGSIGAAYVARSRPDGYTLLVGGTGPLSLAPHVIPGLPYNPQKDLRSISLLVTIPQILVVKAGGRFADFKSFEEYARSHDVPVGGTTSSGQELSVLMLRKAGDLKLTFIPYKGTNNAITDVMGGTIDAAFVDPVAMGLVRSGKLKALAVSTPQRSQANAEVPTMIEQGLPGASFQSFYALSAPAGTPDAVIQTLNRALKKALSQDEVRKSMLEQGLDPAYTSPAEADDFIARHTRNSGELLGKLGQ
ncbi:tripartite tricarboxylate transporter substrate binding protein [Pigmentiphaga soli]|uniref:Tripartite tricarboxylate transporter substrate binding protein n=1 Tax=Pigmentiphaga soli TaxID=1007095 RepID=A0ABP8GEL7_9BURK